MIARDSLMRNNYLKLRLDYLLDGVAAFQIGALVMRIYIDSML